jgi:hypothetical protein
MGSHYHRPIDIDDVFVSTILPFTRFKRLYDKKGGN